MWKVIWKIKSVIATCLELPSTAHLITLAKYKQVAPCAITIPLSLTPGHSSTPKRSRALVTSVQVRWQNSRYFMQIFFIYPKIRLSELSYLFACRLLNRTFKCVDNYEESCIEEEKRHHFQRHLSGNIQYVKKLCQPGPFQDGRWPYGCVGIELV
jgi:hypothetical protein